ncbi:MAG: hypothetical protein ACK5MH_10300 [Bacteroidales bacterium]
MKKNVLFIVLVIFAIHTNAQFNNSRATSVPVSNQIGLEPGTQKIIHYNDSTDIVLSRLLNGESRFYLLEDNNPNAKVLDSYDFGLTNMIIHDFEIYDNMIFFCGSYHNGNTNRGYIARSHVSTFFSSNPQYFFSEIDTMSSINKLKVYFSNNPQLQDGVTVAAIENQYINEGAYINYVIPDKNISGGETYDMFAKMLYTLNETFEDLLVIEEYVVILGKAYLNYDVFTLRIHEKYNPYIFNNQAFQFSDTIELENYMLEKLDENDINFFSIGMSAYNIKGIQGINSGIILGLVHINNLIPSLDTILITSINQPVGFLRDLHYNSNLNKVYALKTTDENILYTYNLNINTYPYAENYLQIQRDQYDMGVLFKGITQCETDELKLAGINKDYELHLFEKIISNQNSSPCHIIGPSIIESIKNPDILYYPQTDIYSRYSPSNIIDIKHLHSGEYLINCEE